MDLVLLLGRILFSLLFILSGINHFAQLDGMSQYAASAKVPAPKLAVLVTGIMLLLGGLSVLLGYQVRVGALLLFLFLVPAAFIMHRFWGLSDPMMKATQMAHFLKNLALAGASLLIFFHGPGPLSLSR